MPCTMCEGKAELEEIFHGYHTVLCDRCSAEALTECIGRGHWLAMTSLEDASSFAYRLRDPVKYEEALREYYGYANKVFLPWLIKFFREHDSGDKECPFCKEHVEHLVQVEGFPLKPCLKCYYRSILSGIVLNRSLLGRQALLYRLKSPDYLTNNQEQLKDEQEWMKAMYRFYVKGS